MCVIGNKKGKNNSLQEKGGPGYRSRSQGKLSIVGIGPGDITYLSQRAREVIKKSQIIAGYKTYIGLLGDLAAGKEVISSGMTEEIKRAGLAIKKAREGKNVCLVSSGDPGIYGMAGLVLELLSKEEASEVKIEIIPGIMAATCCASILGAPLMNDFALISLSDLLTDRQIIKQRIKTAVKGDFVIVFYNPRSKKRTRPLKSAWRILMEHKSPNTPIGIVRNVKRRNEEVTITTLENMLAVENIDMVTTIVVGNSQTYMKGKYMITPRGYELKENKKL